MIANSTLFIDIVNNYVEDKTKVDGIIKMVQICESAFNTRVPLDKITTHNYNQALESSILIIEKHIKVLSLTRQLEFTVRKELEISKKKYELERIKALALIESGEALAKITAKIEKKEMREQLLKNRMIALEQEVKDRKFDLEVAGTFVKDSENMKELGYAYYQAIKRTANEC
jgi:hypothetical protein